MAALGVGATSQAALEVRVAAPCRGVVERPAVDEPTGHPAGRVAGGFGERVADPVHGPGVQAFVLRVGQAEHERTGVHAQPIDMAQLQRQRLLDRQCDHRFGQDPRCAHAPLGPSELLGLRLGGGMGERVRMLIDAALDRTRAGGRLALAATDQIQRIALRRTVQQGLEMSYPTRPLRP